MTEIQLQTFRATEHDLGDPEDIQDCGQPRGPERRMMVPMTVMFQGYAAYVVCQRYLKSEIEAETHDRAFIFTQATVCMHYGKLVARCGHDALCSCFTSRNRVIVAMALVQVAVLIPLAFVFNFGHRNLGFVFAHFALLGIGVGVFEGTYLSVISPMGKRTKSFAILGCPLGLATVNIFGQFLTSKHTLDLDPEYLYWYISVSLPFGAFVFMRSVTSSTPQTRQANLLSSLRDWRSWAPQMGPFFLAKFVGSFVMENTPGWFYVFNTEEVPLFSPAAETHLMDRDLYFTVIYIAVLLGDGISRRVPFYLNLQTFRQQIVVLVIAISCSVTGFLLESFTIASLTVLAAFLAFWGNGLNYAVAAAYIDHSLPPEHNRAVYSLWCMIGDVGSIAGAALVDVINHFFCAEHYKYVCAVSR
eukprot:CAMPEP_0194494050 /NCGR_PEP_ID=MMETSP0253-20130528/12083_1 /TAXON_ID=2966 /ORGANISM="Noctiluca scintillans" /LENGTH=415 /DNA_ID=CAMNT_0039335111 /DNA_START=30 /DNA_END=1277 /DNA_ORIENTATION=-